MSRSHTLSAAMLGIALAASVATTTASAADVAFQRWLEALWGRPRAWESRA